MATGLATGAILGSLILFLEKRGNAQQEDYNQQWHESSQLLSHYAQSMIQRSLHLASLARNTEENSYSRQDMSAYLQLQDNHRELKLQVLDSGLQFNTENEVDALEELIGQWEMIASRTFDRRAEFLAMKYSNQTKAETVNLHLNALLNSIAQYEDNILNGEAKNRQTIRQALDDHAHMEKLRQASATFLQSNIFLSHSNLVQLHHGVHECEDFFWNLNAANTTEQYQEVIDRQAKVAIAYLDGGLGDLRVLSNSNTEQLGHFEPIEVARNDLLLALLGSGPAGDATGFAQCRSQQLAMDDELNRLVIELDTLADRIKAHLDLLEINSRKAMADRAKLLKKTNNIHMAGVVAMAMVLSVLFFLLAKVITASIRNIRQREWDSAQKLAQTSQRFADIALASGDWVWETDKDGVFTNVEGNLKAALGYEISEILGTNFLSYLPDDEQRRLKRILVKTARSLNPLQEVEHWVLTRDGREVSVVSNIVPVLDPQGKLVAFRGVNKDITESIKAREELLAAKEDAEEANVELEKAAALANEMAQAAEAANAAKSQFLATMSHEIRTPMNGVIGMSDLLLDTDLDPDQEYLARTVSSSADALLALLNEILDYSKIEAGKMDLEIIPFSPRDIVDDVLGLVGIKAAEKDLHLTGSVAPDVPLLAMGDPTRVRQVLINLTGNALKFTEQGTVNISVSSRSLPSGEIELHFAISDTGIGIKKKALAKLFEPFSQSDNSTTRKYGGTGLGLTISTKLVEKMRGELEVESQFGQGSTFSFTTIMPQVDDDIAVEKAKDQRHLAATQFWSGLHALVLHEHLGTREALTGHLTTLGAKVLAAASMSEVQHALETKLSAGVLDCAFIQGQHPDGTSGDWLDKDIKTLNISPDRAFLVVPLTQKATGNQQSRFGRLVKEPITFGSLIDLAINPDSTEPVANSTAERLTTPGPTASEQAETDNPLKILLVDDNLVNRKVALGKLKKLGLHAETAINGKEAVAAWQGQSWDLILMDCMMPEMDGYEATRTIRSKEENGEHVPIIAMTANSMAGDKERCLEAGMDDYVPKPINLEALSEAIDRQCGQFETLTS